MASEWAKQKCGCGHCYGGHPERLNCWADTLDEAYRAGQESMLELVNDLRAYTHDWDWKYGEEWDEAIARIGQNTTPCARCNGSGYYPSEIGGDMICECNPLASVLSGQELTPEE